MRYLSVAAICKMESHWLPEWIQYHQLVGVEHFYLYCNDADMTLTQAAVAPFPNVQLIHWTGTGQQTLAYADALAKAQNNTHWLSFLDIDEFLYPIQDDAVSLMLRRYESFSGLVAHWSVFGSMGLLNTPPYVLDQFTRRCTCGDPRCMAFKSIVQPSRVSGVHVHYCDYSIGCAVDEKFNPIQQGKSTSNFCGDAIRVNHYWKKSYADWQTRILRGRADHADGLPTWTVADWSNHPEMECVTDTGIWNKFGSKMLAFR